MNVIEASIILEEVYPERFDWNPMPGIKDDLFRMGRKISRKIVILHNVLCTPELNLVLQRIELNKHDIRVFGDIIGN